VIVDFAAIDAKARYRWMIGIVTPRPVAWVLTRNEDDTLNLAPFSYFNAVASDPPVLMLSIGRKPGTDEPKDTARNILARRPFVVHIASWQSLEALNETSRELPYGESELIRAGLQLAPFDGFALPRLAEAPAAFGCRLYAVQRIGRQHLIFAEIERLWIDDRLVLATDSPKIDDAALDPIARLGGVRYARLGVRKDLPRPR